MFYFFGLAAFLKDKGPWIVKPVASSRGRGVFLVNHVSMKKKKERSVNSMQLINQSTC